VPRSPSARASSATARRPPVAMHGLQHRHRISVAVRGRRVRPSPGRLLAKTHEAPATDVAQCRAHSPP
jgi:hypothetical protein